MRRLHAGGYNDADCLLATLAIAGYWTRANARILDFGCGAGNLTYLLRDRGFQAFGFDVHERVEWRDPTDKSWFRFLSNEITDPSDFRVEKFEIPFASRFFDVIFSTTVLEHVVDLPPVMGELARVLKADGAGLHIYPSRSLLVEPHMYVPFAGQLQNLLWFRLWANIGVRNEFQEGMSARDVADKNYQYARSGLNRLSDREMIKICRRNFSYVRRVDEAHYHNSPKWSFWREIGNAIRGANPYRDFSINQRMICLLTCDPIVSRPSEHR